MNKSLSFYKKATEIAALAVSGKGIIMMPTGTGKTTQTPQLLHELGYTQSGMIYVSVPKRVLAVELSARVAEEMGEQVGGIVGYQIRGESRVSKRTKIIFMTEGILRAKILGNPKLVGVAMILFDEFHQRSLLSDFNVALVEKAQSAGSQVTFLLMSASIDPHKIATHFNCGLVDGSDLDTTYPIAKHFVDPGRNMYETAAQVVADKINLGSNGLVFMPGKAEINAVIDEITKLKLGSHVRVLPLHGDLQGEERHAPFVDIPGIITVTVATDIVETGATLPGVGWVVDSGLAREQRYDAISDTSTLGVCKIARDRILQRVGRCGRVMDGDYTGLFSEEDYLSRPAVTLPEIFRLPLREVVLAIKSLNLSREGEAIRLIDSPPKENWKNAKKQLQLLGFVDDTDEANITPMGEKAVRLQCDPREAAMMFKAAEIGCLREMAIAIAAMQSRQLFFRVRDEGEKVKAEATRRKFTGACATDGWVAVRIVMAAEKRPERQSLGVWCREHYVSYLALQEVFVASRQLLATMRNEGFEVSPEYTGTPELLTQAIVAGLPDRKFSYYRNGWYGNETAGSAILGKESVVSGNTVYAWKVIEVPTRKGSMRIITHAAVI